MIVLVLDRFLSVVKLSTSVLREERWDEDWGRIVKFPVVDNQTKLDTNLT